MCLVTVRYKKLPANYFQSLIFHPAWAGGCPSSLLFLWGTPPSFWGHPYRYPTRDWLFLFSSSLLFSSALQVVSEPYVIPLDFSLSPCYAAELVAPMTLGSCTQNGCSMFLPSTLYWWPSVAQGIHTYCLSRDLFQLPSHHGQHLLLPILISLQTTRVGTQHLHTGVDAAHRSTSAEHHFHQHVNE